MRDDHPHRLALGSESLGERQAAAEGVAVGVFVPEDEDLVVAVDQSLQLVELAPV
jgi:hypothetical protein